MRVPGSGRPALGQVLVGSDRRTTATVVSGAAGIAAVTSLVVAPVAFPSNLNAELLYLLGYATVVLLAGGLSAARNGGLLASLLAGALVATAALSGILSPRGVGLRYLRDGVVYGSAFAVVGHGLGLLAGRLTRDRSGAESSGGESPSGE